MVRFDITLGRQDWRAQTGQRYQQNINAKKQRNDIGSRMGTTGEDVVTRRVAEMRRRVGVGARSHQHRSDLRNRIVRLRRLSSEPMIRQRHENHLVVAELRCCLANCEKQQ
jgi:hypothetical protein